MALSDDGEPAGNHEPAADRRAARQAQLVEARRHTRREEIEARSGCRGRYGACAAETPTYAGCWALLRRTNRMCGPSSTPIQPPAAISVSTSTCTGGTALACGEAYPGEMPDLSGLHLAEIAADLADQDSYEHAWLVNPHSGEILFWTADTGIDGQAPVDLDELHEQGLIGIRSLASWVWYQDMADFAARITEDRAGRRLGRAIEGRGAFGRFKAERPSSARSTRICFRPGTPSATRAPSAGLSNGSPRTRWSGRMRRSATWPATPTRTCPSRSGLPPGGSAGCR